MKIKKIFIILLCTFLILIPFGNVLSADIVNQPSISADASIVIDNKTNKILYSKNENKKMYPASTTKILTAILVIENSNLDDLVTASYDAIMSIPDGYSIANIQIGEQLTVEQLLELLLVHSANDAANVLAEFIGGSTDSFVSMMNTRINELGLSDSHFTNVYGMHNENHYTTAHDLAIIMKYCLKNDTFRKISGQASCSIPSTNKYGTRTYNSTNELLIPNSSSYYKYLTTGKTGFTSQAKECLVSSAYKDDLELIGVVLGSNNRFSDTRAIYDFAYSNYSIKIIANEGDIASNITISNATKETESLNLLLGESIPVLISNSQDISEISPEIILNDNISAPIEEGSILGKIKYTVAGVTYSTNIIAEHNVEKSKLPIYILYLSIAFIFIIICFILIYKKNSKKKI